MYRTIGRLVPVILLTVTATHAVAQDGRDLRFATTSAIAYRLVSVNDQQIRYNGALARVAQIVTRAALSPVVRGEDRVEYTATFTVSEATRQAGDPVAAVEEYNSRFVRDARGRIEIDAAATLPVARDLPVFPRERVTPGSTWTEEAWELHDLRAAFDMDGPLILRFPVFYRYHGTVTRDGVQRDRIDLSYTIFHRESAPRGLAPATVTGRSEQRLYWDAQAGQVAEIEETYLIRFELTNGDTIEYEGRAHTRRTDAQPLDRLSEQRRIQRGIEQSGLRDTSVRPTEEGLAISIERIGFPPDSDRLLPGERERLRRVARLLAAYPDNDILIVGHTALAGTEEGRRRLSLDRARVVGEELIELGARRPEQVLYRGVGASAPIADNATEPGRERNRRVEIIILDN